MPVLRPVAVIFVILLWGHAGCTAIEGAKMVISPMSAVKKLMVRTSKGAITPDAAAQLVKGSPEAAGRQMATAEVSNRVPVSAMGASRLARLGPMRSRGSRVDRAVSAPRRAVASAHEVADRVPASSEWERGSESFSTIGGLTGLSQAGMVTFVDQATDTVKRVPWRAGLNVYGGSALARMQTAERGLAIIREGRLIFQTERAQARVRAILLQPGDVVRLADRIWM